MKWQNRIVVSIGLLLGCSVSCRRQQVGHWISRRSTSTPRLRPHTSTRALNRGAPGRMLSAIAARSAFRATRHYPTHWRDRSYARHLASANRQAAESKILNNLLYRARNWREVEPFYPDQTRGIPKTSESRAIEAVMNAVVLSRRDARERTFERRHAHGIRRHVVAADEDRSQQRRVDVAEFQLRAVGVS